MEETNLILMDLRNKNSPLYNFLKAKNLMVLELNHSNNSMRKSNMSYQPSKKAKNILSQIDKLNTHIQTSTNINSIKEDEEKKHDVLLNSYQNFIIFKKNIEFSKGKSILELKQDEFDNKISYDRETIKNRSLSNKMFNIKRNFKKKQSPVMITLPVIKEYKKPKTKRNNKIKKNKSIKSLNEQELTEVIPDINKMKEQKKYELYKLNDLYYNYKSKPFKI